MVGLGLPVALQVNVAESGSVTVSWKGLRDVIVAATDSEISKHIKRQNHCCVLVMYNSGIMLCT